MNTIAEKIYLFLCWHIKAYGYAPALSKITESCKCTPLQTERWIKRLASDGYIKLYMYDDGDINVKILINPTANWHANLIIKEDKPSQLISEIPMTLFVWNDTATHPTIIHSERDLDKARLVKKGLKV